MLWSYAPATVMVGARPVDRFFGAGRRDLQVGRRGRCDSLLRSGLARRRKDLSPAPTHGAGRGSAQRHGPKSAAAGTTGAEGSQLHRIFDLLAGAGASLLRRRHRGGAPGAIAVAAPESGHYLGLERQAARLPAGLGFI